MPEEQAEPEDTAIPECVSDVDFSFEDYAGGLRTAFVGLMKILSRVKQLLDRLAKFNAGLLDFLLA